MEIVEIISAFIVTIIGAYIIVVIAQSFPSISWLAYPLAILFVIVVLVSIFRDITE